jgi:F-type H+-transporting ATPase subunit delta
MTAASREASAGAADVLSAYARRASAANIAVLADEVLAVAKVLAGQPRLRRALTDPSRSGAQRVELLRSLLTGKVSAATLDVVAVLVSGRWSAPSELLTATERTGVDALITSAESSGELAEVEDELFRFGQLVRANPALAAALSDPSVPVQRRVTLVTDLLDGKVSAASLRLVEVALAGFGGRGFESSLTRIVELTAHKRDREVAYVTVAKVLDDADEQRLAAKLSELYGRQVSLKVDVDPEIIGGISVRVGSDLYDGTILRRLNEARQAFAK